VRACRRLIPISFTAAALLAGGCPVQSDVQVTTLPPGQYWVEQQAEKLVALELPAQRGDETRWTAVDEAAASWFDGPALYALSDEFQWSRDPTADGFTLDDVIQLHDPPPPVPLNP
jgi:hypothetical protein